MMWLVFIFISVVLFAVGTAVGSFINVVVQRSLADEQWLTGRSKCDHCQQILGWLDSVPLLSYLGLQGKSRCCGKQLSISHPVVELLTGTLFVWWYWGGAIFFQLTQTPFQTLQPLFWLVVGVLLVMVLVADLLYFIIPDSAVFVLTFMAMLYRIALTVVGVMQWTDFINTLIGTLGAFLFFLLLWTLTRGQGMGFGDVKFTIPMGLLLGWPNIMISIFLAFISGAMIGILLMIVGKAKFGKPIPFGPFLIFGLVASLLWGDQLANWYFLQLLGG